MDSKGWTTRGGQQGVDNKGWTARGGQQGVDSKGWTARGGQQVVNDKGWTTRGGQQGVDSNTEGEDMSPKLFTQTKQHQVPTSLAMCRLEEQ